MLLKRLQLPPHLTFLLPLLQSKSVHTTEQVLLTPRSVLVELVTSAPREALDQLAAYCLRYTAPQVQRGDVVAARERLKTSPWAGFGVERLDEIVGAGGVIELCGSRGTGKSLLALHAMLRALINDETALARWVDTEGAFNATRAQAILKVLGVKEPKQVLDRITVSSCFRFDPELFDLIADVRAESNDGNSAGDEPVVPRTRVLVIDSIAALFKDTLMMSTAQGHAAMVTVMSEVAEVTRTHSLLTLVTNTTALSLPGNPLSSFSTTTVKPALGTSLTFTIDVSLLIQNTGRVFGLVDEGERERSTGQPGLRAVVEVLKSKIMVSDARWIFTELITQASGTWTVFETDGTALFDVVPPPIDDETTVRRSAGLPSGPQRPAIGSLAQTLAP